MLSRLVDTITSSLPPKTLARIARKTPRWFLDWAVSGDFRNTVRYAYRHSPFYRKRFDSLNIDPARIRKPSDLGDFFTTPENIIAMPEEFLCRRPHTAFESSGTTGKNKRVYFGRDELDRIGVFNAAGLFLGGVTSDDRCANAFDFNIWIPGMVTHKGLEKGKFFELAAGKIDPVEIYRRMSVYNLTVVFGEPTWLIKLTELAEKNGSYPLKFIVAGAEHMPEGAKQWMEKVWHPAKVRMVYGSVESGGIIGFEPFDECGAYHIDENNFLVEVINPDKDGYGEVVYTTLNRTTMPLIRYKNRDVTRLIEAPCACGLPYKRIEKLRGRTDEMIIASGGNLYPLMFDEILKDVGGVSHEWQIIFKSRGMKEVVEFNLELKEGCPKETVQDDVFSQIKTRYPDFWRIYALNIFEISFVYHALGSLRRGRKLLRIVDKRHTE